MSITVAGVDGARGGWMVALVTCEGLDDAGALVAATVRVGFSATLGPALGLDVQVVGLDMPVGLPASASRAADLQARVLLRPCGSRVFPTPPRVTLQALDDYPRACALARAATGRAISRQAWNLLPRVREVDELGDDRLVEVHPELSFALMAGAVVREPKRTPAGRALRIAALAQRFPGVDLEALPRGDDAPDALACAWSAVRIASGVARTLPSGPVPRDERGRPMRIVT